MCWDSAKPVINFGTMIFYFVYAHSCNIVAVNVVVRLWCLPINMTGILDIFHCLMVFADPHFGNKLVKSAWSHPAKPEMFKNFHVLQVFILLHIYHSFFIAGGHICSRIQKTNRTWGNIWISWTVLVKTWKIKALYELVTRKLLYLHIVIPLLYIHLNVWSFWS
jgi:hypothetical protein